MEAQAVFGALPSPSSSLPRSPTQRTCCLFYTQKPILRSTHQLHLAAFHSNSHLFSYSPSRSHAKTLSHNATTKTHIFLPHLVASMVCFFLRCLQISPQFLKTPFEFFLQHLRSLLDSHLIRKC